MFDLKACFYDSDSRRTNYSLKDRRSFLDNRKHRFAWYHFTGEGDGAHEMIRSGVRLCPQEIIMKHVRLASLVPEFAFAALLLSQASTVPALRVQAPVANFNNQGFLDANSARGTLFRLSA